jgi:hypothetical protein
VRARRGELLLLAAGVVASLAFAEVGLRIAGVGRPRPTGYAPVNTELRANAVANARGYRDLDHPLAKPAGVRRIVVLGDSFTWGVGVQFEDAYPQRIERLLSRRRHESWEVVSLALRGMNTVDELAVLESEGFAFEPDVVLLGYCLNDSEDGRSAESRRAEDWLQEGRLAGRGPGLLDRSVLLRFVGTRLWATLENRRRVANYQAMYAEDAPGWVAARKALLQIGSLCRQHGVPLVVGIFPLFGNPLDDSYPFARIHSQVSEAAARAGAKVVDLLPLYRGLRWELLVVDGTADEHPNEIAHRLAAGALSRAVEDVVPEGANPGVGAGVSAGVSPSPRSGSPAASRPRGR